MPYRRTWQSSPFMSPPILIILLPIIALTILFFAVPPLLSATSHVLRPSSVVKKSWDSLNILLVIFAILCGVFARRNDDESQQQQYVVPDRNVAFRKMRSEKEEEEVEVGGEGGSGGYVSEQLFGFSEERKSYDPTPMLVQSPAAGVTRLRRSSSSYPDLRSWETGDDRLRFRFFDDFEIDKQFRSPTRDHITTTVDLRTQLPGTEEGKVVQVKEIQVDTFETRSSPPHPEPPPESPAHHTPPPPPPPPPPPVNSHRKKRRTYQKVDNISEITELDEDRELTNILPPPTAPPTSPPPPPPAPVKKQSEHKHKRSERRKSSVKRDIATVWASVLSNPKKKKQRPKTGHNHNYDNVIDELTNSNTIPPRSPAPPPPPPPLPPSVFHSLFRKGLGKSKKIHSVSAPPPPPPPPPLTSSRRWSKWKSPIPPPPPAASDPPQPRRHKTVGRPPLPNKGNSFYAEAVNAGNQSPLIPVPPPPPPFKMPAMKFVVRGDFVRIRSNQSSLCSSPERDEIDTTAPSTVVELETSTTVSAVTNSVTNRNGDSVGSVFCPSPDVNVKAATFIARLRGEWKLEKLNSLKEKSNDSLPQKGYNF